MCRFLMGVVIITLAPSCHYDHAYRVSAHYQQYYMEQVTCKIDHFYSLYFIIIIGGEFACIQYGVIYFVFTLHFALNRFLLK